MCFTAWYVEGRSSILCHYPVQSLYSSVLCGWKEETEGPVILRATQFFGIVVLYLQIVFPVMILPGDFETWWPVTKCWLFRLDADVKLPLVRLVEEVIDMLSPQMLLLVPMLSWLFKDIRDPLVIPLDVEGEISRFPLLNLSALDEIDCSVK